MGAYSASARLPEIAVFAVTPVVLLYDKVKLQDLVKDSVDDMGAENDGFKFAALHCK